MKPPHHRQGQSSFLNRQKHVGSFRKPVASALRFQSSVCEISEIDPRDLACPLCYHAFSMSRKRTNAIPAILQPSGPTPSARWNWPEIWPYLLLSFLAFDVYVKTLDNGFVWDDSALMLTNPSVIDVHKIPEIFSQGGWVLGREEEQGRTNYYRPLQILSYMAVYHLAGFSAFAFHLERQMVDRLAAGAR